MTDRLTVLCHRNDRFAARLKNLLAAWDFAESVGARLHVQWSDFEPVDQAPFAFGDFFDHERFEAEASATVEATNILKVMASLEPRPFLPLREMAPQNRTFFDELPSSVLVFNQTRVYAFAGGQVRDASEINRAHFARMTLSQPVRAAMSAVLGQITVDGGVAVHMRRGDLNDIISHYGVDLEGDRKINYLNKHLEGFVGRYAPDAAYHAAIARLDPMTPIFLFSDDPATRAAFADRYESRVVDVHPILDGMTLTTTQRAVAEFSLMTRMSRIISFGSAFSVFAATLGGADNDNVLPFIHANDIVADIVRLSRDRADRAILLDMVLDRYGTFFEAKRFPMQAERIRDIRTTKNWRP